MTDTTTATEAPAAKTYRPFLDLILQAAGNPALPDSYDTWGFKITRPDLRTYHGYRWPWPGNAVTDEDTVVNGDACPTADTGGYCIALTLQGARSGGYGHATILLLAYRVADVAGEDKAAGKRRVSHVLVVDVVDGVKAYRLGSGADLSYADLSGANLSYANLSYANLRPAQVTDGQKAEFTGTPAWLS